MSHLLPLFVNLDGRDVVLVGGGKVAASKLSALVQAGARVRVVAPEVCDEIAAAPVSIARRGFEPGDLDHAWFVVAAAPPAVNREVAAAAAARRVLVNAVDDPANATALLGGTIRRDGVTIALSTEGGAPGLTALVREALDTLLPAEIGAWVERARETRAAWKRNRVPMAARKPLLLETLNRLYGRSEDGSRANSRRPVDPAPAGHVSLVGAGPGDPGLLTRAAMARLRMADLVLYDALVDRRVLRYARTAQRFFVGKRAGRQAMAQETIHAVMIRAARRGRRVVRLKGGDPFVFGRGGEEALALARAGVPFEVVPGVTSATAAPALAGIPVTYRGVASGFLVVAGHDDALFGAAVGGLPPNGVTLVVLMGVGACRSIAAALGARGWRPDTPAAIVTKASAPDQRVWRGTLAALADGPGPDVAGPGTLIIGDVVRLAVERAEAGVTDAPAPAAANERAYVNSR